MTRCLNERSRVRVLLQLRSPLLCEQEKLDFVRPWDSPNAAEKRPFARMAEVYAGFVSYTDDRIGRLLDHILPAPPVSPPPAA